MKLIALAILGSILFACNTQTKEQYSSISNNSKDLALAEFQEHPGKKLMENNCYVCHNPKSSEDQMMAPPMVAVKMHYITDDTSKEEFIESMVAWSKQPSEEKSKMPGAIKKFGLMPYQFFPENTIREIADYMYDNEVEEPEWFQEHFGKMHGKGSGMKMKKGRE